MGRKVTGSSLLLATAFAIGPILPAVSLTTGDFSSPKISADLSNDTDTAGNPAKNTRYGFEIAANGENLAMVWGDYRLDDQFGARNNEVYLRTSGNSGQTWGPVTNLSAQPKSDWDPGVAMSGDAAIVAFGGRKPKVSEKQQAEIRRLYEAGDKTVLEIGELFGVSRPPVYSVIQRH